MYATRRAIAVIVVQGDNRPRTSSLHVARTEFTAEQQLVGLKYKTNDRRRTIEKYTKKTR